MPAWPYSCYFGIGFLGLVAYFSEPGNTTRNDTWRRMTLFRCLNKIIQCAHKKTIDWKTTCDKHFFIFLDRLTDKGDKRSEIIYSQAWFSWLPSFCHGLQCSPHNFLFQFWLAWASMADAQTFWWLYLLNIYLGFWRPLPCASQKRERSVGQSEAGTPSYPQGE